MKQIDKTRENINIEALNESERKHLFDKMVKAGGKVVKEPSKKVIRFNRDKQRDIQKRLDDHRRQNKAKTAAASFSRSAVTPASSAPAASQISGGFSTLGLRIGLFFSGVTNFGGEVFKKKFLENFKVEYNSALMELQLIYLDIFKQNPNNGWKIVEQMDKLRPLYYEIIEMAADVYDISIPARLLDNYTALPNERYRVSDYKELITEYFKRLFVLYRYVDSLDFAFSKALGFQQIAERGKASIYSQKRRRAGNSIYIIFNKLFPKLHKLFCLTRGEFIPLEDQRKFEDLLNIRDDMKPGKRIPNQPTSLFSEEAKNPPAQTELKTDEKNTEEKDLNAESIPKDAESGIQLMNQANLELLRTDLNKDLVLRKISSKDKVMLSYLLFKEFDKEYAFIFTTYKVKFAPSHSIRGKSDYRARLTEIYNQIRICFESINEYFSAYKVCEKTQEDKPVSQEQYFNYTKSMANSDREKKAKARAAKNVILNYMNKIVDETGILLVDMNIQHEIIQNPLDILEFDNTIETEVKMKNQTIYEAVKKAHDYAMAFSYRLSPSGDLHGEQSPEIDETAEFNASKYVVPQAPQAVSGLPQEESVKPENKSILGELDDLL